MFTRSLLALTVLVGMAGTASAQYVYPQYGYQQYGYPQRGYPTYAPAYGSGDGYIERRYVRAPRYRRRVIVVPQAYDVVPRHYVERPAYGYDQYRDFGRERTIYRSR